MPLSLTREVRFGLHPTPPPDTPGGHNGFAANPALAGIAPFLTLRATIAGDVDPHTGMLINIKRVDQVIREHAVPYIRAAHFDRAESAPRIVLSLFGSLHEKLSPHALTTLRLAPSPYLAYAVKEPPMVRLSLKFEFSAAHRLHAEALSPQENLDVFGRCNNPSGHGHNYELEVELTGPVDASGQLISIPAVQKIINQHIIDPFDHKHLNVDCAEFANGTGGGAGGGLNPTVENIAKVLYHRLKPHIPKPATLSTLRLWETPKTMCEFSE